jgi:hypothetical protein
MELDTQINFAGSENGGRRVHWCIYCRKRDIASDNKTNEDRVITRNRNKAPKFA